jgi:hypothetical protein
MVEIKKRLQLRLQLIYLKHLLQADSSGGMQPLIHTGQLCSTSLNGTLKLPAQHQTALRRLGTFMS